MQVQQPADNAECVTHPSGEVAFRVQGVPGPQGATGKTGPAGSTGPRGAKGERGLQGVKGDQGEVGPIGMQGQKGETGQKGYKGDRGEQGLPGLSLPGPAGPVGPQGPSGPTGPRGAQGDRGLPGARGLRGYPGEQGPQGRQGVPGGLTADEFRRVTNTIQNNVSTLLNDVLSDPCIRGKYAAIPASSCKEIHLCSPLRPSGYYWVNTLSGPQKVYCLMNTNRCGSETGGWMRVGKIDMTNSSETCPSPLKTTSCYPKRLCTRQGGAGCSSVLFTAHSIPFTQVCGQAIGYQYKSPDAFAQHFSSASINDAYLDGLSITCGSPRYHLWSYAIGHSESDRNYIDTCPCASQRGARPSSFIQDHYYCESGNVGSAESKWYLDDPLWEGKRCPAGNTCCNPPNMPWFHRRMGASVTDDIEVRWCRDEPADNESIGVELLELYTQ